MTPATIIERADKDGVRLALTPVGTIKARGKADAVNRWLPVIRENKPAIVAALQSDSASHVIDRETFGERVAIREYDGGYA